MKTKLVYVLTCTAEATYIEQALMSIFSARYWNKQAQIILLVDNLTDKLLIGKRAEILNYISQKIVVPFDDNSLSAMYRSRWIKTSVRQLIDGDFLFIDSDTIIQYPLESIDNFDCEIGAVLESHLKVFEYCESLYNHAYNVTKLVNVDINEEKVYYSSGVMYVKDSSATHQLYELWHKYWSESFDNGLPIDQPALAKANRDCGHLVRQINDTYNCILFTQPPFYPNAHILHIAAYKNPSFLFEKHTLNYVKENGLNNVWLQEVIKNPSYSILPFDYNILHSNFIQRLGWIKSLSYAWKSYGKYIDNTYSAFQMESRLRNWIVWCFRYNLHKLGMMIWLIWKRWRVISRKDKIKYNICSK